MTLYSSGIAPVGTICDLRSDTVTRPCAGMRAAMADAEVGDDCYGEDPTVLRLEAVLAERTDKAAGLFFPTGCMSNLAALMAQCARGEEVIVGRDYHVYADEAASASVLGALSLVPIPVAEDGGLEPAEIRAALKPEDVHYARSRLLCLENTVGGRAVPLARMAAAVRTGREAGLSVHLDGARFFNAVTALGSSEAELAGLADTVSLCLSKGLGAPAGTVLVGPTPVIAEARRLRKLLGGGMRQSGVLAAAGLWALEHQLPRLAEDHARAARLARALIPLGTVRQGTNMVFFTPPVQNRAALAARMAGQGVRISDPGEGAIRLVVHRDVDDAALTAAIAAFESCL
ncbi:threonine aldolase [Dinoroseobacter shibae DFL 12 = DSM 16493]|jgi:threonine aldolase|uniref:Threonine aldolase n=1 Tax=Dinoroseobacter shibae (strain DSM 16493 / NCIMB 14021 / DFL 12) TaxID=398580 RepID=A8LQL3_DINSH|nr:low-specificity L-threonine aldolase [Dinoroseobacter shibae]ABV93880.1 threonine aldolase [Dinoroseobacter shibae DFL 12 = DSM 16493]URF45330.1 low-specificity L-threonine aldolase [Dinoroseobacter shibae]URF49635.1 low-specificity L-threonine aldolase [Dinoroseobacter shibae]